MAFTPSTKSRGDVIQSKDWNDAMHEISRLGTEKVNKAGDDITGQLTIAGNLGVGTTGPRTKLHVHAGRLRISESDGAQGSGVIELANGAKTNYVFTEGSTGHLHIRTDSANNHVLLQTGGTQGNVGIGTSGPLFKLHAVGPGGFGGEDSNGISLGGSVPLVAQSNSTAIGIINADGRQAFALNIDGNAGTNNARGVPTFYDKYDGNWHLGISLKNGNVGIGNRDPRAKLDISGSGEAIQCCAPVVPTLSLAEASNTANRQAWLQFHNAGEAEAYIRLAGGGPAGSGREGQRRLEIGDNQGVMTSLTVAGNVGIGTTGPTHKFHVVAPDAVGLFESSGGQAYLRLSTNEGLDNRVEITNRPGGRLSLWTAGGGDVFNILRAGNVGIGTINPGARLDVWGTLAVKGIFMRYIQSGEAGSGDMNPGSAGRPVDRLVNITFSPAYSAPPNVIVAIRELDVDHEHNTRINVWAENVTAQGFTMHFNSWADTHVYSATATWVAHGVL